MPLPEKISGPLRPIDRLIRSHERQTIRRIKADKESIKTEWDKYKTLKDEDLQRKTKKFRERLQAGESLDDVAIEAFATVCEAACRVLGYKEVYDVQIMGALALYENKIAQMQTGEGKTLVVALASYVKALTGDGVHVVTANDYLAKRDADEMADLYTFLGLNVDGGITLPTTTVYGKQKAYQCDITYGTASEFGFDYLRDQTQTDERRRLRRKDGKPFAVIDEVDHILLDQARTPLNLNKPDEEPQPLEIAQRLVQKTLAQLIHTMEEGKKNGTNEYTGDYYYDKEDTGEYGFTPAGISKIEQRLGIEAPDHLNTDEFKYLKALADTALEAQVLHERNDEYIVLDGILIPREGGRPAPGHRFGEGLHQALEAKEGLEITPDSELEATIAIRDFFNLYTEEDGKTGKKAGTTGTAQDAAQELETFHGLHIVPITPHLPSQRNDHPDIIYRTKKEQFESIVDDIIDRHYKGQPILVGTNGKTAIEDAEILAEMLSRKELPYNLLTAKNDAPEAEIVAQAGKFGAITISAEMAGRGTDIKLGGDPEEYIREYIAKRRADNPHAEDLTDEEISILRAGHEQVIKQKVVETGGLYVIGVGLPDSKRNEKQLRGRAGRQGDPGETQFYFALEGDTLLTEELDEKTLNKLKKRYSKTPQDIPIESWYLRRYFRRAQRTRTYNDAASRMQSLDFDHVLETQRKTVYDQRQRILESDNIQNHVHELIEDIVTQAVRTVTTGDSFINVPSDEAKIQTQIARLTYPPKKWDFDPLWETINEIHPIDTYFEGFLNLGSDNNSLRKATDNLKEDLINKLIDAYDARRKVLRTQYIEQLGTKIRTGEIKIVAPPGYTGTIDIDGIAAQYADQKLQEWEKETVLHVVDREWQDYLHSGRRLQGSVQMRALAQGKVLQGYYTDSRTEFNDWRNGLQIEIVKALFKETPKDLTSTDNV